MTLTTGTRLGHYEILAPLGAGGMGEVYRARDTKLHREVAIKVLPETFAADPDRVARFEREAQLLASVNHPHIAGIYGIEGHAIVLELVDGPTLSDRIAAGPLPIEDALPIARQIAEALEGAHEKGVVHRDLKPGNIKLTSDGEVKVLDFGLAKLLEREGPAAGMSHSPTLTAHATFAGLILGTAPYMSPEQARGRPVDKRADIWAFGCVLFEMLTGRPAFPGEDVTETLGAVIHKEPPWDALSRETPAAVLTVLQRCLQKDPKQRLRDIGDARIELSGAAASTPAPHAGAIVTPSRSMPATIAGWLVAAVLAIVAGGLALVHLGETPPVEPSPVRFELLPPPHTTFGVSPIVSPDGRRVAFTAREVTGREVIWVRPLDALTAHPLAGTESAANPVFWSPDSRFIGFASGGALKKVDASGGAPVTICPLPWSETFRGGAWSPGGTIIFSALRSGLWQVAEGGGTPSPLTSLEASQDTGHGSPGLLSDGRHFVYLRNTGRSEDSGVYLGSLDTQPEPQQSKRLVATLTPPVFAPSADPRIGYILYLRDGTLMAQRFDAERFETQGDPVPMVEDLTPTPGPRPFSAAAGVLAYRTAPGSGMSQLTWFDRHGKPLGQLGSPAVHGGVGLSRDGQSAVTSQTLTQTGVSSVWSIDLARGVFTRVNPASKGDGAPVVSDDGRVAFTMLGSGVGDLFWRLASGAGEPELLVQSAYAKHTNDWSPDGRWLVYDEHHPTRRQDLNLLPLTGDRKPIPILASPADETLARFSPDGKWLLYRSDESGRSEIYVRDFAPDRTPPIGTGKWTISSGGDKPRWSRDGKEIYYIAPDRTLMAVPVTIGSTFKPGVAVPLFKVNPASYDPYDVAPDGRFLITTLPDDESLPSVPITIVLNWQSLLPR